MDTLSREWVQRVLLEGFQLMTRGLQRVPEWRPRGPSFDLAKKQLQLQYMLVAQDKSSNNWKRYLNAPWICRRPDTVTAEPSTSRFAPPTRTRVRGALAAVFASPPPAKSVISRCPHDDPRYFGAAMLHPVLKRGGAERMPPSPPALKRFVFFFFALGSNVNCW